MGTMVRAPLGGELAHSDFVPGAIQRTLRPVSLPQKGEWRS